MSSSDVATAIGSSYATHSIWRVVYEAVILRWSVCRSSRRSVCQGGQEHTAAGLGVRQPAAAVPQAACAWSGFSSRPVGAANGCNAGHSCSCTPGHLCDKDPSAACSNTYSSNSSRRHGAAATSSTCSGIGWAGNGHRTLCSWLSHTLAFNQLRPAVPWLRCLVFRPGWCPRPQA
jgi:hypothetical protein